MSKPLDFLPTDYKIPTVEQLRRKQAMVDKLKATLTKTDTQESRKQA